MIKVLRKASHVLVTLNSTFEELLMVEQPPGDDLSLEARRERAETYVTTIVRESAAVLEQAFRRQDLTGIVATMIARGRKLNDPSAVEPWAQAEHAWAKVIGEIITKAKELPPDTSFDAEHIETLGRSVTDYEAAMAQAERFSMTGGDPQELARRIVEGRDNIHNKLFPALLTTLYGPPAQTARPAPPAVQQRPSGTHGPARGFQGVQQLGPAARTAATATAGNRSTTR